MKCASVPSSYRNWTFFTSVWTRGNFSPARNVLSTTAPATRLRSFVRTNAPPLPGLTCWNSRMRHTLPSSSMCIPFLKLFVSTMSAISADDGTDDLRDLDQVLAEAGEVLDPVLGDDDVVLD